MFIVAAVLLLPQFASAQSQELKVMSYNIRLSTDKDGTNAWKYRCPATLEMIKDQNPDAITFLFSSNSASNFSTFAQKSSRVPSKKSSGINKFFSTSS